MERCKGAGGSTLVCPIATSAHMDPANRSILRIRGQPVFEHASSASQQTE